MTKQHSKLHIRIQHDKTLPLTECITQAYIKRVSDKKLYDKTLLNILAFTFSDGGMEFNAIPYEIS